MHQGVQHEIIYLVGAITICIPGSQATALRLCLAVKLAIVKAVEKVQGNPSLHLLTVTQSSNERRNGLEGAYQSDSQRPIVAEPPCSSITCSQTRQRERPQRWLTLLPRINQTPSYDLSFQPTFTQGLIKTFKLISLFQRYLGAASVIRWDFQAEARRGIATRHEHSFLTSLASFALLHNHSASLQMYIMSVSNESLPVGWHTLHNRE